MRRDRFRRTLDGEKKGFFQFPHREPWKIPLALYHVLGAFAIYFGIVVFAAPLIATFLRKTAFPTQSDLIGFAAWINLLTSSLIAVFLLIFWKSLNRKIARGIWRDESIPPDYSSDIALGAVAWVIAFPLVLSVSQFLDVFVYAIFHVVQLPDQLAVAFLKMTFSQPFYFLLTIISIIVVAPFIEELIFRGFLQTYARKFVSPKNAILISSVCFSFFHYTPEQGLGNIPIIGSLFVLALFLGFLYERQRSLLASISLHACFNAISVLNLYCLGGAPRGAL